jgi:hypothetical protein
MGDDFYKLQITRRPPEWEYVDPRPVLFCCAICEREIYHNKWQSEGRSRQIGPICLTCEMAYGTTNLSSWRGPKMDARIARRVKAAADFLQCLANRTINERKRRGA